MPIIDQISSGCFCWVELATTDQAAAKSFYGELFGWTIVDEPMCPDSYYTLFQLQGRSTGAAYQLAGSEVTTPPNWMLYIAVESADETAAKVAALGGKLIAPPFEVSKNGCAAIIQDPTGAVFCIWQAMDHKGIGITGNHTLCWADLSTNDPAQAAVFYEALFGWKLMAGEKDTSGYLHIQNSGEFIGGIPPAQHRNSSMPAHWLPYFGVASCDESAVKAEGLGARLILPPMSIPDVGRMSVVADPQGAVFALFQN